MPAIPSIGNQDISFGTVEVLQTYGTVEQASLDEFQTEHEIPDTAGGIQVLLLLNPDWSSSSPLTSRPAWMESACAATSTGNPIVIGVVRTLICDVELPRLIPDRPTLEQVEAVTQRG